MKGTHRRTYDKLDAIRASIGTLAHNRSFTAKEVTEYTRHSGNAIVNLLLRRGYIQRTEHKGHYYPTTAGWTWIEEGTQL
jgi:hypothetical protein